MSAAEFDKALDELKQNHAEAARRRQEAEEAFWAVEAAAHDAGDTWFRAAGPTCWDRVQPEVSKTVVVVIPNRSHNKQLVPPPVWKHWVDTTISTIDDLFGGSTIYAPAMGSYWESAASKQHLDQPYIVEAVAGVEKLRKAATIRSLVTLCHAMAISMDQDSVLLIVGGVHAFFNHPWKRGPKGTHRDLKLAEDENQATAPAPGRERDYAAFKCGNENYEQYLCTWAEKRIRKLIDDRTNSIDDAWLYSEHYCRIAQELGAENKAPGEFALLKDAHEVLTTKKYRVYPANSQHNYLRQCPHGSNASDKLIVDLLAKVAQAPT